MTYGRERRCDFCNKKFDYDDLQQEWVCSECNEADIPTLRTEVARLEAENERMRGALEWLEVRLEDYLREEWQNPIVNEMKNRVVFTLESTSALSPSTDESESTDE